MGAFNAPPPANAGLRLTEQFLRQGDLSNLSAKASGRKKTARTPHKISKVKQLITENPKKSSQRLAQETATSKTTLLRILKKDLKLKPYKTVTWQKLSKQNKAERQSFASWFLTRALLGGRLNAPPLRFFEDSKKKTAARSAAGFSPTLPPIFSATFVKISAQGHVRSGHQVRSSDPTTK